MLHNGNNQLDNPLAVEPQGEALQISKPPTGNYFKSVPPSLTIISLRIILMQSSILLQSTKCFLLDI